MTDPVRGRTVPSPTYNEALERGAARTHYEEIPIREPTPEAPPSIERVSRPRQATVKDQAAGAAKVGKLVATEVLIHRAKHGTNVIARGFGHVAAPIALAIHGHHLFEAISGDTRRDPTERARIRENYGRATAQMASGVLPRGYVQERLGTHAAAAATLLSDSRESLRVRLGSAERAEATMQQFQTEARHKAVAGQEFAAAYDLRSPAQLDALLKKDASFRERFESDLAFAEGVRAMVWLGANDRTEFAARQQTFTRPSATSAEAVVRQLQAR